MLGIEGGFTCDSGKKYDVEEHNSLVILPSFTNIPLPCENIPNQVSNLSFIFIYMVIHDDWWSINLFQIQDAIAAILGAESVNRLEEMQAMAGMWDGEKRVVSK